MSVWKPVDAAVIREHEGRFDERIALLVRELPRFGDRPHNYIVMLDPSDDGPKADGGFWSGYTIWDGVAWAFEKDLTATAAAGHGRPVHF